MKNEISVTLTGKDLAILGELKVLRQTCGQCPAISYVYDYLERIWEAHNLETYPEPAPSNIEQSSLR